MTALTQPDSTPAQGSGSLFDLALAWKSRTSLVTLRGDWRKLTERRWASWNVCGKSDEGAAALGGRTPLKTWLEIVGPGLRVALLCGAACHTASK